MLKLLPIIITKGEIMSRKWTILDREKKLEQYLSDELSIHPVVAHLLIHRGIKDLESAEKFLLIPNQKSFQDPFLLKGMEKAINRIRLAKDRRDKVLIFGDYDVDGVTSSALLFQLLQKMDIEAEVYLPHRMEEGYGLSKDIVNYAKSNQIDLLITVDCGITSVNEVASLNQEAIDVIIVDHHEPSDVLPDAIAIVDPKQKDCKYPFKYFAAVGLVAKLWQAMEGKIDENIMDLVAIGTIADVVPLYGENRAFVKFGLPIIPKTSNTGLQALLQLTKLDKKVNIRPFHIGFVLGPRINAPGRMDTARRSLDLFLSKDFGKAEELAKSLEEHNINRQRLQRNIFQEATELIDEEFLKENKIIVLSRDGWHKGVLGIVASKVTERYGRPSIIISVDEDKIGVASARSVEGINIYDALTHCSDYLEHYGGHKGAAGLTIKADNISSFRKAINEFIEDKVLAADFEDGGPLMIDGHLGLPFLNIDLINQIKQLEPFGEGNPEPIFCSRGLTVTAAPQVLKKETLKFWVSDGRASVSVIGFGMGQYRDKVKMGSKVDIAYQLSIDDWNKAPTVQLMLKDVQ